MNQNTRAFILLASGFLTFGAFACGDDDSPTETPDSGTADAGEDSGPPSRPDAGSDGGTDAGDAGSDASVASVGVTCEEADVADATMTLSRDPSGDVTFSGLVHVTAQIDIGAATVEIEPGTTFIMDADTGIEFGWNSNDHTLMAAGTEALPIRFCGKSAQPGYWRRVTIGSAVTSDSVLEHVILSNGGGTDAALILNSGVRVAHVSVEDSAKDGVHAERFAGGSTDLSVTGAGGIAVVLTDATALDDFPLGGEFADNDDNSVHLRFRDITTDTTIKAAGIPYVQEMDLDVHDVALTIQAGVAYHFAADAFLDIGWNSNAAELQVEGEEDNPVVFQGVMPTKGYYRGIIISPAVRSSSKITHARILHGGGLDTPALQVTARITLDNVTLEDNEIGAVITSALQPASTALSITGTEAAPLTVHPTALTSLPEGGSFSGNEADEIRVEAGTSTHAIAGTIPDLGVPYHVLSDLSLEDGADVEIAAGTEFIMAGDVLLEVGWNFGTARLSAVGTATEPIVFAGEQDTAGYWRGIVFRGSATSDSALDYVVIANAGQLNGAALELGRAIPVTNTTIRDSAGAGIEKEPAPDDPTDYEAVGSGNMFMDIAMGNVVDAP